MTAPVTPTGPFVVTHDRPHAKRPNCQHHEIHCPCVTLYREAFATLDLARKGAFNAACDEQNWADLTIKLMELPEAGGSIRLPNGDVIEVDIMRVRVMPDPLDAGFVAEAVDFPGVMSQGETEAEAVANLIDAANAVWNAEHGIGIGEAS